MPTPGRGLVSGQQFRQGPVDTGSPRDEPTGTRDAVIGEERRDRAAGFLDQADGAQAIPSVDVRLDVTDVVSGGYEGEVEGTRSGALVRAAGTEESSHDLGELIGCGVW